MIETNDLSKQYQDLWAVNGLDLHVEPGQILALLGQNGAGKTTTVRMLTALLLPTRGSARVAGFDVVAHARDVRAAVGVLTEQHGLYTRMTGTEYLEFFAELHGLHQASRRIRKDDLLDYFGLAEVAHRRIAEYSKGMRQKLALARALVHEPPVLLLDEPTSAMDPESARLVRDEIARLRSGKRTIVICTHNLGEAEALADKVAIIYHGRLLLSGSLDELKRTVLGAPEFEAQFSLRWQPEDLDLPRGVELIRQGSASLRFRVADPVESNPILMRELASMRAPLVTFQEVPRSLEQVYLRVMAAAQTPDRTRLHA
jgi:ABC-2 type transport system ATP-binding protein